MEIGRFAHLTPRGVRTVGVVDEHYDPDWDAKYGPWFDGLTDGDQKAWIARRTEPLSEGAFGQLVRAGLADAVEPNLGRAWPDGLREFLARRA